MKNEKDIANHYNKQKERLEVLRKLVKLNPVEYLIISDEICKAKKYREKITKYYPHESIDSDYTNANNLEYTLRLNAFIRKYQAFFAEYQKLENYKSGVENLALNFIDRYVQDNEDNEKEKEKGKEKIKRKVKK